MSKKSYRIRNWSHYNKALIKRGSITVWLSKDSLEKWDFYGKNKRGGVKLYSDFAIEVSLIIKEVYNITYRACQGFLLSLKELFKLKDFNIPNYSTLCRRAKNTKIQLKSTSSKEKNIVISVDSTGISVLGETEWYSYKHRATKRQVWKKLHLAIDNDSLEILSFVTTDSYVHDASHLEQVINNIAGKEKIAVLIGDGSYSLPRCHKYASENEIHLIAPPHRNSRKQSENRNLKNMAPTPVRDEAIDFVRGFDDFDVGIKAWKLASNYHRRSLVENSIYRLKRIFGESLREKSIDSQNTILSARCAALNKMTSLGMPDSFVIN